MCGSEWQRFGSCCSAEVSKYDARQRAVSADLIKRAKKQVSQLSDSVSEYMESFKAYISSATPRHGGRARFQIKSKTQLNQAQKVALSNRMLTSLEAIQNWINQHKFNMVEAQNTCIQKLQRERSAAVCYTCSGRAHEFFTKNSLNMHEMTCRSIIKECANSWWYLIGFLDQVNKFNNLITQVEQEAGIKMLNNEGVSPAKTILNWADQTTSEIIFTHVKTAYANSILQRTSARTLYRSRDQCTCTLPSLSSRGSSTRVRKSRRMLSKDSIVLSACLNLNLEPRLLAFLAAVGRASLKVLLDRLAPQIRIALLILQDQLPQIVTL